MTPSDQDILSLIKDKKTKEKGFVLLMNTFQKQMYWQIREMTKSHQDSNDILQNVFIKVWKYIDDFKSDSKLSTWLFRIARNESITFINKTRKRQIVNMNDETKSHLFNSISTEEYVDTENIYDVLKKAIDTLPPRQKIVFELRYFKEMKYSEMASKLSLTEGSLKASYHHAVKKIEEIIKEN